MTIDAAEAAAALAAGMAAFRERQAPAYDPMGGAVLRDAADTSTSQPDLMSEPGEPDQKPYPQVGPGGVT